MPQLDDGYRRGNRRMWYRRTVRGRCVPRNASNVLAAKSRRANVLSLSRHVPSLSGSATRRVAQNEARKRRADERHVVGCCEELARSSRKSHFPLLAQIEFVYPVFNVCAI